MVGKPSPSSPQSKRLTSQPDPLTVITSEMPLWHFQYDAPRPRRAPGPSSLARLHPGRGLLGDLAGRQRQRRLHLDSIEPATDRVQPLRHRAEGWAVVRHRLARRPSFG
jgi:hypothetical protein